MVATESNTKTRGLAGSYKNGCTDLINPLVVGSTQ